MQSGTAQGERVSLGREFGSPGEAGKGGPRSRARRDDLATGAAGHSSVRPSWVREGLTLEAFRGRICLAVSCASPPRDESIPTITYAAEVPLEQPFGWCTEAQRQRQASDAEML